MKKSIYFQLTLLFGLMSFSALSQNKTITAPGEFKFSTEFTFGLKSKTINLNEISGVARNERGQITHTFNLELPNDTTFMYRTEYNSDGLVTKRYSINRNEDTLFDVVNIYNQYGDLMLSKNRSEILIYEYNNDSNFRKIFAVRSQDTVYSQKEYFDSLKRTIRTEQFSFYGRISEVLNYNYKDNGNVEIEKENTENGSIVFYTKNKNDETIFGMRKLRNGGLDTFQRIEPVISNIRLPTVDETTFYGSQFYPENYKTDTFPNGKTKSIFFKENPLSQGSIVEYTLNNFGEYKTKVIYSLVYKSEFDYYKFIDIFTNKTTTLGKPKPQNKEVDAYTNSNNKFNGLENEEFEEAINIYIVKTPQVIKDRGEAYYKSIFSYETFIYDTLNRLVKKHELWGWGNGNSISYKYDENHNILEKTTEIKNSNGILNLKVKYEYNKYGKLLLVFKESNDSIYEMNKYDFNGNHILFIDSSNIYEYENTLKFNHLGKGLAHRLGLNIPKDGFWQIELFDTSINMNIELLDLLGFKVTSHLLSSSKTTQKYYLKKGSYQLLLAGKNESDIGVYFLKISQVKD